MESEEPAFLLLQVTIYLGYKIRSAKRERYNSTYENVMSAIMKPMAEQRDQVNTSTETNEFRDEGGDTPDSQCPTLDQGDSETSDSQLPQLTGQPPSLTTTQEAAIAEAMLAGMIESGNSPVLRGYYDPYTGGFIRDDHFLVHTPTEMEKRILADAQTPLDPPPTPEEVHEAEMNPWPGHTMIETILRNRGQMQSPPSTPPQQPPPQDPNLPPQ